MVELEGIDVKVATSYAKKGSAPGVGKKSKESKPKLRTRPGAHRSRSTQSLIHDPGGLSENDETSDEDDPDQPSFPVDLAQSFLQDEAQEEKEKLKAAIINSCPSDGPPIPSEIDDDDSDYGFGNALFLPSFLADFLRGVGDRIELKVKKVILELDLKLELGSESPSATSADGSEVVTIRLSIGDVDLQGVMPTKQPLDQFRDSRNLGTATPDKKRSPVHKTRQVAFHNIELSIVSNASLFVNLSRFDVPPSPVVTQSSSIGRSLSKGHSTTSSSPLSNANPTFNVADSAHVISPDRSLHPFSRSEASSIISDGRRFADPEGDEEATENPASIKNEGERIFRFENESIDSLEHDRSVSQEPSADDEENHFDLSFNEHLENSQNEFSSDQYPSPSLTSDSGDPATGLQGSPDFTDQAGLLPSEFRRDKTASQHENHTASPTSEDLTQSRIFSHEEAESMYMSAISHDPCDELEVESAVPGRWDGFGSQVEPSRLNPNLPEESTISNNGDSPLLKSGTIIEEHRTRDSLSSLHQSERSSTPTSDITYIKFHDHDIPNTGDSARSQARQLSSGVESHSSHNPDDYTNRLQSPLVITKKIVLVNTIHIEFVTGTPISAKKSLLDSTHRPVNAEDTSVDPRRSFRDSDLPEKVRDKIDPVRSGRLGDEGITSEQSDENGSTKATSQIVFVEVGQLELLGDIGLTKLTILLVQQNLELFENVNADSKERDVSNSSPFNLRLRMAQISWKFLDMVRGFNCTDESLDVPSSGPRPFEPASEVLLKASLDNVELTFEKHASIRNSRLSVEKASFGYATDDIVSFDPDLKMRESTGDTFAPVGKDVVLIVSQTPKATEITLTTLPLRFVLDLRRLDETFGWFGGFSSILGLGSSMMSTVTVVSAKPAASHSIKRSRGVHFEQSVSDRPTYKDLVHARTFTARLGGLALILQGASCAFRLDGTALKAVGRMQGVGLRIDKLRFTGPYVENNNDDSTVNIHLANIRVECLTMPKEADLARLLSLLSPSKDKYEQDDDILLETLLHQRRQGGVIRITIDSLQGNISKPSHFEFFLDIAEELKKLSTMAKYLPADDRPGILTFCLVREFHFVITASDSFGSFNISSQSAELAHVSLPSLTALAVKALQVQRNDEEELIGNALPLRCEDESSSPTIMARFIGNEMEPIIKVKIQNLRFEYHVSTIVAAMKFSGDGRSDSRIENMISSITTLKGLEQTLDSPSASPSQSWAKSDKYGMSSRSMRLDITLTDTIIGLNPLNCSARGLILLTDAHLNGTIPKVDEAQATLEIKRASILIIDEKSNIIEQSEMTKAQAQGRNENQMQHLIDSGFVSVSLISSAKASISVAKSKSNGRQLLDVEIRDDLFILETCADSTQTLQMILNGLIPPVPPNAALKYQTEIVSVEDMLASFSGDAFTTSASSEDNERDTPLGLDEGDMMDDEVPQNLEYVSSFYNPNPARLHEGIAESMLDNDLESLADRPAIREIGGKRLLESFREQYQVAPGNAPLDFQEDHFGTSSTIGGTAHRWDTKQNTYGLPNDFPVDESPLRLRIRDVHIIWNLFDGYDWPHTRDIIAKAVTDIESKAAERHSAKDKRQSMDVEGEGSEIGDFLFNSIYIGVSANRDPKDLARQVNRNINDLASETESYAPSSVSSSPNRQNQKPRGKGKKLRLTRSKYHKMTFELKGVSADLVVFPPGVEETQSSIDVRVQDLDIFDHVPTSTWKKFATYMHDAGERESGTSMVHLEILNVKPVPTLAASEIILKVCFTTKTVL